MQPDASFGGDSLTEDLNADVNLLDVAFMALGGILVFIMVPAVGLFYAGLARKKHSLSLVWASLACGCMIFFQWFFWGYSFVFGGGAGSFWGTLQNFGMMKVLAAETGAALPDIVFMFYQGMFAAVTGVLMMGGAHERARLGPLLVFIFVWISLVYCPCAEWTWNPSGWLYTLGALDFAGGGPVHQASGCGALAYALILGRRRDPVTKKVPSYKPGSVLLVFLGTVLLWFGWFGFNGMSAGAANLRAIYAMCNTNIAAASGGLVYMTIEFIKKRRWSTVGLCTGCIAGLVGITPAAGFVNIQCAFAIGAITAAFCNGAAELKYLIGIDDGLDVYAIHGVGGAVGSALTGLFAADYISHLDGASVAQGWMNHHWKQLGYQLAAICAVSGWSFVVTSLILLVMNYIPGLKIRMSEEEESMGSDKAQLDDYWMFEEGDNITTLGGIPPTSGVHTPIENPVEKPSIV